MHYLPGMKESEWDGLVALKKLKGVAVSCLVMEVLDLYFCVQPNSDDAAECAAIYCPW